MRLEVREEGVLSLFVDLEVDVLGVTVESACDLSDLVDVFVLLSDLEGVPGLLHD